MQSRSSERTTLTAFAAVILGVNIFVAWRLFFVEYLARMDSIESAYIALARYTIAHWGSLTWFPVWYAGMPYQNAYQPGLPVLSAAAAQLLRVSPALAYHLVIAILYSLGPVFLFLLADRMTGRRGYSFFAGLAYSLISPSAFLVPAIRHGMGGPFYARRYQALVYFGEGPNVAALTLVPLALLAFYAAFEKPGPLRVALAALSAGPVMLVSWPATVVLALAAGAFLLSRDLVESPKVIAITAAAILGGYLLIGPWIPLSTVMDNQRNAQTIDGYYPYSIRQLIVWIVVVAAILLLRLGMDHLKFPWYARFTAIWSLLFAAIALGAHWFGAALLPQPERFHLAMEIPLILAGAYGLAALVDRLPPRARTAIVAIVCLALAAQLYRYHRFANRITQRVKIESTYEYQFSNWLARNLGSQRVYATGSLQFWMNIWTDTPQAGGCCLPGLPNPVVPIMTYFLGSSSPELDPGGALSILWLKAFGVHAVVVGGKNTRDAFHDRQYPAKFEGALPVMWRQGDDVVYAVPGGPSLAHAVSAQDLVAQRPENGLDVAALRRYVAAIDDPQNPAAEFLWRRPDIAEVKAVLQPKQLLSVQITYSTGWQAEVGGRAVPVRPDGLGLMAVQPACDGPCTVLLHYGGGTEGALMQVGRFGAIAALVVWAVLERRRRKSAAGAMASKQNVSA